MLKKFVALFLSVIMFCTLLTPLDAVEAAPKEKDKEKVPPLQKEIEVVDERTANSQVFLQEDGLYRMEVSSEPIHVQDKKTKKWEPIDNTLDKKGNGRFHNKKNQFDASFSPKIEKGQPLLSIEQQGKKVEITNVDQNGQAVAEVSAAVKDNKVTYKEVYSDTDIAYTVGNSAIKEDIVLKEKPQDNQPLEYSFQFDIKGLTLEKTEDGYLYLLDSTSKERLFAIEKPFMMDSAKPKGFVSRIEHPMPEGSLSDQIKMEVTQHGDKLALTLQPSMEWLTSPERVYPIIIDPTVKVYQPKNDLNDTTIRSASPDTTGGADLELGTGFYSLGNNIVRSLIQFDVGTLPKGARIMNAQLNMRLSSVWNDTAASIGLYEMSSAWEENRATWNRRTLSALWANKGGDFQSTLLSSQTVGALDATAAEPQLFKWTIKPDTVQKWVEQPSQNLGLMLKATNETLATYKKFYSGDYSGKLQYSPKLTITYYPVSRLGLEDHWSYAEHSLADGQGHVNLGTGNLVLDLTDFEVSGRGNSGFSFNRTYNSKAVEDSPVGYGWSFTGSETMAEFPNGNVLYTDADGTAHTFTYDTVTKTFKAPAGLYLQLVKANTDAFVLTDYNGNRVVFRDLIKNPEQQGRIYPIDYEEDRNKNKITYQRQADGTLTGIKDASGRTLTFTYQNGRIISTSFEGTKKTAYTYDANGYLKTSTIFKDGTSGSVTTFSYNANGELISVLDGNNQQTTYTYTNGFLTNVQKPTIADTAPSKTTYSYDIANYTATETDPKGNQTHYLLDNNYVIIETIDPMGNSTSTEYDANYNPTIETDGSGNQTVNTYDSKGNLLTTKDPEGNTVTYTYNSFSQPLTITDSKGTTTNVYNSLGDLIEEINPAGEKTVHEYDSYGNLINTTLPDGTKENYAYDENKNYQKSVTDPLGRTTITMQDKYGNTTSVTNPASHTTYYSYDLRNLLTKVKDAKGNITSYDYDANGNLKTATNAAGKQTLFTYNGQNQLTSRKEPLGETTTFVYDENGNTKETVYPSGDRMQNIYDKNNQLAHVAVNGSRKWTYNYDANGNIDAILNVVTGDNKTLTYDKNGKVKTSKLGNQSIEYGYDSTGVATAVTGRSSTQSFSQAYTIDKLERLTHLKRNGASQATLTYNKINELEKISYINGISSVYAYDAAGQLKTLTVKKGTAAFDNFTYEYDTRGNITSATSDAGTATYEYDANNQLTKEATVDGTTISYEYDAVGNRIKQTTVKNGQTNIKEYTYNANNQLKTADSQTYSYDANGNRIQDGQYKYVYNKLNELVEIQTLSGQTVAKYNYDEEGRRTSKTVSGQTTYYHYDEEQVLFETNSAGMIIADYSYDDSGRPLTMTRDGKTYYYVLNEHKDVTALTDASGNTVASYTYDAWGNTLSKSGPMADVNPYRYASYRFDSETDLYYLLARYYEPKDGTFLSIDPQPGNANDPISQHPYVYVQNNPVMLDDPDGENPLIFIAVRVGGKIIYQQVKKKAVKSLAKKYKGKITISKYQFSSKRKFIEHYEKHVLKKKEFGKISKSQYLLKAQKVINSKNTLRKTRANGDKLYYKKSTNEFVAITKKGTIKTYFKPKNGLRYFLNQ